MDKVPAYNEIPVGVILDMGSWLGKTVHSCITMAVSDFYTLNSNYTTRIVIHNRDTHGEPLHALSAALDLLKKPKVQAIIGSESTTEAKLLAVFGDEAEVPILSLSPTPSSNKHPYFLQITQDETTQFKAIAAMADSFKWKNVIIISEDTDNTRDMAAFMAKTFQEKNVITYMSLISPYASSELVNKELHKLSTMQTKVFIMHACHSLASHVLINAKYLGMIDSGYKWIITSKTMNLFNFMDDQVIESMHGVVGLKSYIPQSRDLKKFISKWRKDYELKDINVCAIGVYDAVSALAMAVERTQDLKKIGSARCNAELLNQMLRISFDGLGGAIQFMNGRVSAQVLEIINVIGKGEQRVGFWTKDAAFTKNFGKVISFSDDGLEAIVWPGGIQTKPTHRMLQVRSKLRIGIPVNERSFGGLFQVQIDAQTKKPVVSGYCVDMLLASFYALDQHIELEFIPANHKNVSAGTGYYDHLIAQVHAGVFDAGVGDITITSNRSKYVDFTLPFTDLGLGILSRNADTGMWIFMKPLSTDLWVVSGCFFILLGFVIWILEHRSNEEFQGSPVEQIVTTIWFAFSTIVYVHRQKLQSNLSRFVVTVWLFVVLVLVSSYTATLSSLLTVEQIQLASKRGLIGYSYDPSLEGVFVRNFNKENMMRLYAVVEYYAKDLARGSKKGGIDALVAEIPYIKEFLAKHPTDYTLTPYEGFTGGFGFNKWLNPGSKDSVPSQKVLNFNGLRGLFLISGVSMAAALFIFMSASVDVKKARRNIIWVGKKKDNCLSDNHLHGHGSSTRHGFLSLEESRIQRYEPIEQILFK
ncbi:Extracellular ligand-binding receptor [Artemisia annua]|uniref:Glutamate receptor n=1 Tax=Artemisia annua TaxID=35608 RepID=A0A2U1PTD4_ARTAN|nr:Extracellular ligand-binding receptor [Artemisia annua]